MELNHPLEESIGPDAVQRPHTVPFSPLEQSPKSVTHAGRVSQGQIVDFSRTVIEEQADFDPTRAADIRTKILSGAYHSLDVAEQVARAILQRDDLPATSRL